MKVISATILSLLIAGTQAMASGNGGDSEGLGFMATLFIGFGVLIILFQTIPAILLFAGMVKGLLSSADKKPAEARAGISAKNP
ncbi:MAG: hypothetical protein A2X79_01250 [Desulfuromonadaceae bacterium GWB2_53_15]|nr:MAG: hypothetical protein A2X83_11130 [Desulfuromonadales bacterium GWD2_54_10]OHB25803.1 MAG: hypothetical protein A2X79_01250 [Desulfuromonadaceae bacterium GWB2_53_15]